MPNITQADTGGEHDTLDTYRGADGGTHRRFRLGPEDTTPTVKRYPPEEETRQYHWKCFGCWNGSAHSEAYHDANAIGPRFRGY